MNLIQKKTSAFKRFTLKPQELKKTVEDAVTEAITNRSRIEPEDPIVAALDALPAEAVDDVPEAQWPMPVDQFRQGHYLEPGDIVLSTRLESFFSFLVKRFDKSDFAHAALTFVTPRYFAGVDRSYLIEATFSGVDLRAFSEIVAPTKVYKDTREPPRYVVGIKRLESDWFTPNMRPMIGGRMLRFIKDDDYNFALLAALAVNRSKFFFRLRDRLFGKAPTISDYLKRTQKFAPVDFICSGFVQFAYIDMVRSALEMDLLPPHLARQAQEEVFFAPWVSPKCTMEELMAVKPMELAECEQLQWKYLIYAGKVHKVSNSQDVSDIFERINVERQTWHRP